MKSTVYPNLFSSINKIKLFLSFKSNDRYKSILITDRLIGICANLDTTYDIAHANIKRVQLSSGIIDKFSQKNVGTLVFCIFFYFLQL